MLVTTTRNLPTVGARIKDARESKGMTQQDVGKLLGISRAAVAQWESDVTSCSVATLAEVAKILEVMPQWLAFGISQEPRIVVKEPDGTVKITEVTFGDKITDVLEGDSFLLPTAYVTGELHAPKTADLILYRVESDNMAPEFNFGDKVIVDRSTKRPTPSGVFLLWDGVGPSLNRITVTPGAGSKPPVARVASTNDGDAYDVPADKLQIIGRVRGVIKSV